MKVRILVEFEVEPCDASEDGELQTTDAKGAASMAAWNHLCLTESGMSVRDSVRVHVDGYGECLVRIGEDHE